MTSAVNLAQLYEDSRDNYKILRTLERHFTAIVSSPVPDLRQIMLPMLNALRLVWATSAHYSDDTRMCALLQRVAHSICDRAQQSISTQARSCLGSSTSLLWSHLQAQAPGRAQTALHGSFCRGGCHTTLHSAPGTLFATMQR